MHAPWFVVIHLGSKPNHVVLTLCGGVHPRSRDPVVRSLLEIAREEVLPHGLSHFFEEVPEAPDDWKVPRHRVVALGQIGRATRELTRVLAIDPDDARAHTNLGVVLERQGQVERAVREFQEALRIDPQQPEARLALEALGRWQ